MRTADLKLPVRLRVSLKKRLSWIVGGILSAPLSFLLLTSPILSWSSTGLSSSQGTIIVAVTILLVTFVYPFFLMPYVNISEKGITEWESGLILFPWFFRWETIDSFKVVETHLPVGLWGSWILPYKRKGVGINFKQGLITDPLSGEPSQMLSKLSGPTKFFTGVQMVLEDTTNLFDKTIYGQNPEELVSQLNLWREQFSKTEGDSTARV